ncbi:zinc finger BED domain-containing protein RICESLEEPER 2 [Tanacetum coccineum]
MEDDDTIVEETPILNVGDSDSGYKSEPQERAAIWEHYDSVRIKNDPNTRKALCKYCKKTLAADGPSNDVDKHLRHWETKPDFCVMVHDMVDTIDDDVLNNTVSEMVKKVVQRMEVLFKTYKTRFDTVRPKSSSQQTRNHESSNQESSKAYGGDNDFVCDFLNLEESGSIESESELTRYLNEPQIRYTRDFDIL